MIDDSIDPALIAAIDEVFEAPDTVDFTESTSPWTMARITEDGLWLEPLPPLAQLLASATSALIHLAEKGVLRAWSGELEALDDAPDPSQALFAAMANVEVPEAHLRSLRSLSNALSSPQALSMDTALDVVRALAVLKQVLTILIDADPDEQAVEAALMLASLLQSQIVEALDQI